MSKVKLLKQPHTCNFCGKSFLGERTLIVHLCEKKRRVMQESEKRVQIGYRVYNRFFKISQGNRKEKSYLDFCESSYYNAFVRFGSFISNINPLYPEKFIDYVIKSGVKLDQWCTDQLYEKYLYEMLKEEPVESAVQRSLQNMMEWGDENTAEFQHYFLYATPPRVTHDIVNGRITPWILLNTVSGQAVLRKMSTEQLEMIAPVLDMNFWVSKFKENPADVALIREIATEVGIK
jgi:hypothetical protein